MPDPVSAAVSSDNKADPTTKEAKPKLDVTEEVKDGEAKNVTENADAEVTVSGPKKEHEPGLNPSVTTKKEDVNANDKKIDDSTSTTPSNTEGNDTTKPDAVIAKTVDASGASDSKKAETKTEGETPGTNKKEVATTTTTSSSQGADGKSNIPPVKPSETNVAEPNKATEKAGDTSAAGGIEQSKGVETSNQADNIAAKQQATTESGTSNNPVIINDEEKVDEQRKPLAADQKVETNATFDGANSKDQATPATVTETAATVVPPASSPQSAKESKPDQDVEMTDATDENDDGKENAERIAEKNDDGGDKDVEMADVSNNSSNNKETTAATSMPPPPDQMTSSSQQQSTQVDTTKNKEEAKPVVPVHVFPRDDSDDERYDFPEFPTTSKRTKRKKASKQNNRKKKLKISLRSVTPETEAAPVAEEVPSLPPFQSIRDDLVLAIDNTDEEDELFREQLENELDDSLFFFQETHEEQDPAYILFIQEREDQALKMRLQKLELEDAAGRKEIDAAVALQSKEKQTLTDRNIEKYKLKAVADEKRDMQRLLQLYNEKVRSNQNRIDQGNNFLGQRHKQDMQKAMNAHRQQFGNQAQSPQAQAQWAQMMQQLQAKQQRQMQEFRVKGDEMKQKTENDFKTQQEKLRNQYQKKQHEIETSRRKVFAKIVNGFQQLRQRYLKRHLQKISRQREALIQTSAQTKQKLLRDAQRDMAEASVTSESEKKSTSDAASSTARSSKDEKEELRPPSPVKSTVDWVKEELLAKPGGELTGASARHKQRKSVLSQTSKQLGVEIHNEGIWITVFADKSTNKDGDGNTEDASNRSNATRGSDKGSKSDDKKDENKDGEGTQEFIPWGQESHSILQSIVCGEIPTGYSFNEKRFMFGNSLSVQGGHVRCVITDLRTSEITASSQRAASVKEQEEANLKDLEKKIVELSSLANEAEATLNRAEAEEKECRTAVEKCQAEVEKGKKIQQDFRAKFSPYLGPDGQPLPTANPSDRQQLVDAILRYKSNLDTAEKRLKAAKGNLTEAHSRTSKMQAVAKHAQKAVAVATGLLKKKKSATESKTKGRGAKGSDPPDPERAANRVKDVIGALHRTAEKRREQLNQKRSSSASSTWVQALPGLPGPLKKSLWHKMHRRRQQIVLRPSLESLTTELRDSVSKAINDALDDKQSTINIEDELLRAEQMLYIAMHPEKKDSLSSVPPSSSSGQWAEPGWLLNLDVLKVDNSSRILPCAPAFPVFSKNHAEICSAPGRQAAAFSKPCHLQCLASSLSTVATATSLAELNPSVSADGVLVEGDPLDVSEELLKTGYDFRLDIPKPAVTKRKSSSAVSLKESAAESASELTTTKKQASTETASAKSGASAKSVASAKSTDASTKTGTSTAASASTTEKKKAEPKKRRGSRSSTTSTTPRSRKPKAEPKSRPPAPAPAPVVRTQSATYNRQPATPAAAAAAAAQYNQYMSHSPSQQQQAAANYQFMQQQQVAAQGGRPPQRSPTNQYGSPQQQHQMAQLRMMQQQQQQSAQGRGQPMQPGGYPPQPQRGPGQGMPPQAFFNPMAAQPPGGAPQGYPAQHMAAMQGMQMQQMGQPPPNVGMARPPPNQQQRQQQQHPQQNRKVDDQNDPLFMLK